MRATLLTALFLPGLLLVAPIAGSEEPAVETAAAVTDAPAPAVDKPAEAKPVDAAASAVAKAEHDNFVLPPGFKVKKRGKYTLYCRKDPVIGTRFESEKCYDETGVRDYLQAQRENQEKVDQMRRVCATQGSCGSN
jgi:hypothetical protein